MDSGHILRTQKYTRAETWIRRRLEKQEEEVDEEVDEEMFLDSSREQDLRHTTTH